MYVAYQFQEIFILLTDDRFVPVLKQVAGAVMPQIEVDGMPSEKTPHEGAETGIAWPEQEMNVVCHKRPGKTFGAGLHKELGQVAEEPPVIVIVTKDITAINATDDHVLQKVRQIYASSSWHGGKVAAAGELVN